jgi:hypothetical protein
LTTSYVAGTVLGTEVASPIDDAVRYNQLVLNVAFTKGSLTSAEIKVEYSDDNTTFYQEIGASITGGTETDTLLEHTIGATGNYAIPIEIAAKYIRISAKGTGTVTSSEMTINAVLAVR